MRRKSRLRTAYLRFLSNDKTRKRREMLYLELLLGAISAVMSCINIATHQTTLLLATALTAVISLANAAVFAFSREHSSVGVVILTVKIFALFTYFIIWGGTEGFSTIWLLMVPACGPYALGRKKGVWLSLALLAELVLLFYTPLRDIVLRCDYTQAFLLRFPVVYLCFLAVGFYLEYNRETTYEELSRLQVEALHQSQHDPLTGLYNRLGFTAELDACIVLAEQGGSFALLIVDIDWFKRVNDSHGHDTGDRVLQELANRIRQVASAGGVACRWGGEEFAVLLRNEPDSFPQVAEQIRLAAIEPIQVGALTLYLTLSVGGVSSRELGQVTSREMVLAADRRLYTAKDQGRNRCVCSDEENPAEPSARNAALQHT